MVSLNTQNDLGMPFWEQDQLQLPSDMSACEQAPLYLSGRDTDHPGRSEFFTEDAILAAGLSDTLHDNAPFIPSLAVDSNASRGDNAMHAVCLEKPSSNPIAAFSSDSSPFEESRPSHADIKLRSASCKPKRSTRMASAGPKKEVRARECHNLVEKQYRTRLKAQFEALLAVLPIAQPLDHGDRLTRGGPGQYLSRGQVLDAARERILELEEELEEVASVRDDLLRDLTGLHRILQEMGFEGIC
ncbi:BHLH domain-containing protein [Fusarium sp. LHS14.1]|nr:BHLH domain-containing protein [Fusarium sp. LHS14.1]